MIRGVLISAVTASIVVLALDALREPRVITPTDSQLVEDLTRTTRVYSESVEKLGLEVQEIRDLLARSNRKLDSSSTIAFDDVDLAKVLERVKVLEEAMGDSTSVDLASHSVASNSISSRFSPEAQESVRQMEARYFIQAEEYFESDSGAMRIAEYSDSISETLQTMNGIDVRATDCRESICKVTYLKSESLTPVEKANLDSDLIDKLVIGLEGHDVELRHATDPYGNELIYIQLQ